VHSIVSYLCYRLFSFPDITYNVYYMCIFYNYSNLFSDFFLSVELYVADILLIFNILYMLKLEMVIYPFYSINAGSFLTFVVPVAV